MKKVFLIAALFFAVFSQAQTVRVLTDTAGKKWRDTTYSGLYAQSPLGRVNDSTLGLDTTLVATRLRAIKIADSVATLKVIDTSGLSARVTTNVTAIGNLQNRNINTGFGLIGGGNLTADRTILADTTLLQKKLAAGTGIAISGNTVYATGGGGGGGTPGGSDKQVQYNSSGAFGGNSGFVYDYTNQAVGIRKTPAYPLEVADMVLLDSIRITRGTNGIFRYSSIFIGDSIGKAMTSGNQVIAIGDSSLTAATTANGVIAIGRANLQNATTANNIVSIIPSGGATGVTTGSGDVFIGSGGNFNVSNSVVVGTGVAGFSGNNNTALGQGSGGTGSSGQNTTVGQGARWGSGNGGNSVFGSGAGTTLGSAANLNLFGLNAAYHSALSSNGIAIGNFSGATSARIPTIFSAWFSGADAMQKFDSSIFIGNHAKALNDSSSNEIVIGTYGVGLGTNTAVLGNYNTRKTAIGGRTAINANTYRFSGSSLNTNYAMAEPAAGATLDIQGAEGGIKYPSLTTAERDALSLGVPLKNVTITAAGSGYPAGPFELSFSGGGGSGARGIVTTSGGTLLSVIMYSYGNGYTSAPTVSFTSGSGSGGTLASTIQATGGLTLFCSDCTATDGSTGVVQTYNGASWKNHW